MSEETKKNIFRSIIGKASEELDLAIDEARKLPVHAMSGEACRIAATRLATIAPTLINKAAIISVRVPNEIDKMGMRFVAGDLRRIADILELACNLADEQEST